MVSRRLFFGIWAGALSSWPAVASAFPAAGPAPTGSAVPGGRRPDPATIFYSDEEIVVANGWVLRRDEAERAFGHAD